MSSRFPGWILSLLLLALVGCDSGTSGPDNNGPPEVDRYAALPSDAQKITPEMDLYPPILHSDEFEEPEPVPAISTAGGEDSPFIPAAGGELYFFFAADVQEPHEVQIRDPVNGIWVSKRIGDTWQEPTFVWLQDYDELALNGCEFVEGDEMLFCSAREGYTGVHWFRAERINGTWANWEHVTFPAEYDVGELHVHGDELYYGSPREGGAGGQDIWMLTRSGDEWMDPVNVSAVNTDADETRPYVSPDGSELWITRWYMGTPAVVRSRMVDGEWQEGELVVSQFAGEPTLDADGNLYFVHHFYDNGVMLEGDIYVAHRK